MPNHLTDLRKKIVDVPRVETVKPKDLYFRRNPALPGRAGHAIEVIVQAPDRKRVADVIESVFCIVGPEELRFLVPELRL